MYKKFNINEQGFTLVELSIVLVIIGFLIAGITSGAAMIKQAKVTGQVAQMQELLLGINNFKGKYNGLPGDIKLTSRTIAPNAYAISDTDANTVIGNGDGYVEARLSPNNLEDLFVWGQLSSTKMISGNYLLNAQTNPTTGHTGYVVGINTPIAKIGADVGYELYLTTVYTSGVNYNWLMVGKLRATTDYMDAAAITPGDAFVLDKKIDDGKPSTGVFRAIKGTDAAALTCVDLADEISVSSAVQYMFSNTDIACRLMIKLD